MAEIHAIMPFYHSAICADSRVVKWHVFLPSHAALALARVGGQRRAAELLQCVHGLCARRRRKRLHVLVHRRLEGEPLLLRQVAQAMRLLLPRRAQRRTRRRKRRLQAPTESAACASPRRNWRTPWVRR